MNVSGNLALDLWHEPEPEGQPRRSHQAATFAPRQTRHGTQLRRLPQSQPRGQWRALRQRLEQQHEDVWPRGEGLLSLLFNIRIPLSIFAFFLRVVGLYNRGIRNALDLQIVRRTLFFNDLPMAFDGYRILHITDPHFDACPGLTGTLINRVADEPVDLAVMTGDYRAETHGPYQQISEDFAALTASIQAEDGVVATLGNHDCAGMVPVMEALGITVLNNELIALRRGADEITIAGIDDVHCFHTKNAVDALSAAGSGFRIAAIHSAELADSAAAAGFDLYVCGHSHGGQIAWPNGNPIFTGQKRLTHLSHGEWELGGMTGHTGRGSGVCGLPVRYNTRPEVAVLTLRRGNPETQ